MRIALPFIFVMLICAVVILVHEPAPHIDDAPDLSLPVYSACKSNMDCALVAQSCGSIAGVRKERLQELKYYYTTAAKFARCDGAEKPAAQRAVCQSGRCTAVDTDGREESEAP